MTTEPTDAEIVDCIRSAKLRCVHPDAETTIEIARAVLAKWGTPPAVAGEPVAWRHVDARGHFRYVGYKPSRDMAAEYPLLKPIRLYTHPSPLEGMAVTDAMIDAGKKMLHNSNGRGAREKVERIFNAMIAAADMATASAQGFRDGVASISANAESEPVYQARYQKGFWQDSSRERCEYLQNPENTCAEDWETRILYTRPPTSSGGVEHG